MNIFYGWTLVCGIAGGIGTWSLVTMMPRFGYPKLRDRIAPYVSDISSEARTIVARSSQHPVPILGALLNPPFFFLRDTVSRIFGGTHTITRRMCQAGTHISVEQFRSQQVVWGSVGFIVGMIIVVAVFTSGLPVTAAILIPLMTTLCGFLSRSYVLYGAAKKRITRIESELPTVLEFITLSLSAGENIHDALRRVVNSSSGELSVEFRNVLTNVTMGVSLAEALQTCAYDLAMPQISRCVDQIVGALERGTPLTEVLRAQACDARSEAQRTLLEQASRKEIVMLFPLVFLILPLTVCFAIFPGIFVISSEL